MKDLANKGQNVKCTDTPNWKDNHEYGCQYYKKQKICKNGKISENGEFYAGERYNFPEMNCCECGKSDKKFFQKPSSQPKVCTHLVANSYS